MVILDNLEDSADYRWANIPVRHNISSSHELETALADLLAGSNLKLEITGKSVLYARTTDQISTGQIQSLGLIVVIILLLMAVVFSDFRTGILSLIPNAVPVVCLFRFMGWMGISVNQGTNLVAVFALSVAIDNTIHLFTRFNREIEIQGDLRPVLLTSVAVALGFTIFGFSAMRPVIQFGLLSSLAMLLAFTPTCSSPRSCSTVVVLAYSAGPLIYCLSVLE